MAFDIGGDFDLLEFNIPAGKNKTVMITVPPIDCVSPADIEAINKKLRELEDQELDLVNDPNRNVLALVKLQLKHFNPAKQKADAIDALLPRWIRQIDKIWTDSSEMDLGESSPSTEESSETDE